MKKREFFPLFILAFLVINLSVISAINLDISEKEISSLAIIDLDKPALFDFTITNNEPGLESFEIYSLVGIRMEPSMPFTIPGNSTQTINVRAYPRQIPGYYSFEYKIKDSKGDIQTDELAISIVELKNAFNFYADNIEPGSETAKVYLENKANYVLSDLNIKISSIFFSHEESFSLSPKEIKEFEISVNQEKAKELLAGPYILNANLFAEGKPAELSSLIRFTEQSGLETTDTSEGVLLRRHEVIKINQGNTQVGVETIIKKDLISSLFTTFNINPTNKDRIGFYEFYIFEDSLAPGQMLKVVSKTNWWLLVFIIVGVVLVAYLTNKSMKTKLKLMKRVSFVKTKGGEFALKISLILKASDFVERIKVVDRIPTMVKLYERYGTITPDKIDEKNKRLEWNVESLDKGEERIFSYIIYSKMGIVGRFELPKAEALYEFKGKLKELTSNQSFFINEPGSKKPFIQNDGYSEDSPHKDILD